MLHYETCLISILSSVPINANPAKIIISLNLVFNQDGWSYLSLKWLFEAYFHIFGAAPAIFWGDTVKLWSDL